MTIAFCLTVLVQWQVFFSPGAGTSDAIVRNIDSARVQVLVQAYSFTSGPIATALVEAKKRGCDVRILLDRGQRKAQGSQWLYCVTNGIPVVFDTRAKIQHNKVILIDSSVVITGSYNFTKAAETANAENLLIVRDSALVRHYLGNFFNRNTAAMRMR